MLAKGKIVGFIATRNARRSRAFFEKKVGLRVVSDDPYATVCACAGTTIRIQKVDAFKPHPFTSLGWEVKNIAKEATALKKRGVKFERYAGMEQDALGIWHSPSGAKVAWFKDPDGNVLSLTEM